MTSMRSTGCRVMTLLAVLVLGGCSAALLTSPLDTAATGPADSTTAKSAGTASANGPTFVYQKVYNGAQFDSGHDEVVDGSGNAYILARAYDSSNDVMIVKLSPGGAVLFVTYLRGYLNDWGTGLALDGQGGLLVCGWTDSPDFPVVNAAQPTKDARRSAFLARLSTADGAVAYSSFFGAGGVDEFHDVAVNPAGEIFLVGVTDSTDFPTQDPLQAGLNVSNGIRPDAVIVRSTAPTWAVPGMTQAPVSVWTRPGMSTWRAPGRTISPPSTRSR
jgi:hypothetical protein